MKKIFCCTIAVMLAMALALPAMAAQITQGKCISYDTEKKSVTIEEYDLNITKEHPYGVSTGKQVVINVATSLIGATPEPGNILRIAYQEKGQEKVAIRIMNMTKQDLMKR
jgi:hypothetical protein